MADYLVAIKERINFIKPRIVNGHTQRVAITKYNNVIDDVSSGQIIAVYNTRGHIGWRNIIGINNKILMDLVRIAEKDMQEYFESTQADL